MRGHSEFQVIVNYSEVDDTMGFFDKIKERKNEYEKKKQKDYTRKTAALKAELSYERKRLELERIKAARNKTRGDGFASFTAAITGEPMPRRSSSTRNTRRKPRRKKRKVYYTYE